MERTSLMAHLTLMICNINVHTNIAQKPRVSSLQMFNLVETAKTSEKKE